MYVCVCTCIYMCVYGGWRTSPLNDVRQNVLFSIMVNVPDGPSNGAPLKVEVPLGSPSRGQNGSVIHSQPKGPGSNFRSVVNNKGGVTAQQNRGVWIDTPQPYNSESKIIQQNNHGQRSPSIGTKNLPNSFKNKGEIGSENGP